MPTRESATERIRRELRDFALACPGAHSKSPWPGHDDVAVNDKTFLYLSSAGEPLSLSCKLPRSAAVALLLPGTSPTAYGLGRSGWVTLDLAGAPAGKVDVAMLRSWIDESYRAQAPKKLIKLLEAGATAAPEAGNGGSGRSHPPSRRARR